MACGALASARGHAIARAAFFHVASRGKWGYSHGTMPPEPEPPPPPAAPAPPKKKRRVLRIALYVLGIPLVLASLVVAYLHTGAGKARVRGAVRERLQERTFGQVELGVVDYALFGEVKLGDLHLKDPQGTEVVALSSLTVQPSWGDLLRGRIVISRVALSGLAVHVIKDADGGSNLQRLIKPRPEDPQRKPLDRRIDVDAVSMDGVAVDVTQPDGTRVILSDVAVSGAVSVQPADRMVDVELDRIGLSALVDKGRGGLKLGLTKVATGLSIHLDKGAGKATLQPLAGRVGVTLPDQAERGFDIALGGFSADIGEGGVGVSLDKLLAGAVALASVEVKGRVADGKVDGSQQADVLGLKVSGARVNELLGRDVLVCDIDVETHVLGPPDKIAIATKITTGGTAIVVDGAVGVADPAHPTYDVAVTLTGVDTEKVLAPALGISPVLVEKIEASVKGQGREADSAGAVAKVEVTGATARGVRIDGLTFEGELDKGVLKVRSIVAKALGQRVTASGEIELATKRVDLTVGVEGDVGDVLGRLGAAGLPVKASVPRGAVRLPPGDLTIQAKGFLSGAIDVEASAKKLGVFGGSVRLGARASLIRHDPPLDGGKKVTVTALDADFHLGGVKLSSLLAMRGKKLEGMDGTISGEVHVEGTPERPRAKVALGMLTSRADGGKTVRLSLSGDVAQGAADIRASLMPSEGAGEIFGLTAKLPLSLQGPKKGVDLHRPLALHASLPRRSFADVWALVPDSVLPAPVMAWLKGGVDLKMIPGDLALELDVAGTAEKPDAKLEATVSAKAVLGHDRTQKVAVAVTLKPGEKGLAAKANVGLWLDAAKDKLVQVKAEADLSRSPALGPAEVDYRAGVTVGPLSPKDLFMLDEAARATPGTAFASIDLTGNKQDLAAHLLVSADDVRPGGLGPLGLGAAVDLGEQGTTVDVRLRGPDAPDGPAKSDLLVLAGKVGLAGKGLFARLKDRDHLDPTVALALDIPKRALASLAWLQPALAKAPGNLSGSIPITGTVKAPLAKGALVLGDVLRANGQPGGAVVAIDAGADELLAKIGVGVPDPVKAPLQITLRAPRGALSKMGDGAVLPASATIRADKVDITQLLPAALQRDSRIGFAGTLDWNMDIQAGIVRPKPEKKIQIVDGSIAGALDLHDATIALPGTTRAYRDVGLLLKADAAGLHLDSLRAKESDADVKERTLVVKGDIGLDKLRPTTATLSLAAEKWLLFGPRQLGFADAPRGALSLAATARADFTKPIRAVSASIGKLEFIAPERFERAHQPEDVQAGDLVFLGEDKTPLGKLPVPASVAEAAGPKAAKAANDQSGWDIDVHLADGVHLLQAPIEIWPSGDISVKVRPGGREIKAAIDIRKGGLSIGGHSHGLVRGTVTFDAKHPKGFLDLAFERPMRPAALRQISEASGGTTVEVHMFGPLADRKMVLSGAGTAGALWDVLSMHNVGRARYVSEPDLPWSISTEFPQHDNLLVLGFLAVNLPHLLFLDRFAVWGDPYDDPRAYGKLTHLEAERFAAGNALRVRVGARPPSAGQSEAEAEIDYVIVNVPRMLLGVGVTGGTRGGGGPGIVWEWSSKD